MEEKVRSFPLSISETLLLFLTSQSDSEEKSDEDIDVQALKGLFSLHFDAIFELLLENGFALSKTEVLCIEVSNIAAVKRLTTQVKTHLRVANASSSSASSLISSVLPGVGMEQCMVLDDGNLFRHGSSLRLMAQVTEILNSYDFDSGLNQDWRKNQEQGRSLYFAALEVDGDVASVLRGSVTTDRQHVSTPKLIIDYVKTKNNHVGGGLATKLVDTTRNVAKVCGMDLFVVALENSAVFWLKRGFILEKSAPLNKQFNSFSDTFLLKDLGNVSGVNDPEVEDLTAPGANSSDDEPDDENVTESTDQDADLQRALFESMK